MIILINYQVVSSQDLQEFVSSEDNIFLVVHSNSSKLCELDLRLQSCGVFAKMKTFATRGFTALF